MRILLRKFAPFVPYLTVGIGLFIFRNAWIALSGYHAVILLFIILSRPELSFKLLYSVKKPGIALSAALAGAVGGAALYFLWPLLSIPENFNRYVVEIGLNPVSWPFFLAYFIIINPVLEEYFWRGYLGSVSRSLVLNDFLFSGYHLIVLAGYMPLYWLTGSFIGLAATAWVWRQFNRSNGGILASTVSHLTADIIVILTIYWFSTTG